MVTNVYVVRDILADEAPLILTAPNDDLLKRQATSALLDQNYNFINTNRKDKVIYAVGTYDTKEMIFHPSQEPVKVCTVDELFLALVEDIRIHNKITEGISKPVEVPDPDARIAEQREKFEKTPAGGQIHG